MGALIFVCGPYDGNGVKNAVLMANELHHDGHFTYVPHINTFQDMISPRLAEYWLAQSKVILTKCDGLFRLKGDSLVADSEVAHAKANNVLTFTDYRELLKFFSEGI